MSWTRNLTLFAILGFNGSAWAADEAPLRLSCKFDRGQSGSYEAGAFKSQPASALSFEISDINLEVQSAKISVDGKVTGTLRVVRALNANHYLEVANEGFLNLTTVYDLDPAVKAYPAVHSRHFGLFGQALFAQYTGLCTPM
jgi:hypothetical protein